MTALIYDHRETLDTVSAWPATGSTTGLAIQAHAHGQGTVLRVSGELDLATAPILRQAAHDLLDLSSGPVHLDLSRVTFFDCAGLGVLIGLCNTALHTGGIPPRITASRPVRRLITLAGLGDLFDLDPAPSVSNGAEGVRN